MYKSLSIPFFGWCSIQTRYRQDRGSRWGHSRGRLTEHVWQMPLWRWDVTVHGRGKSYRELTGFPKYSIDWILDEFDSSFNDLAVASLRYHLGFSVCDNEDRRPKYEDLIERLTEPRPRFTEEELAILRTGRTIEEELDALNERTPPDRSAVYDAYRAREDAYLERIRQARHDFVDIMPELWS